ncbi:MAG: hypothetical protein WKF83_00435 [Nocardioidaceae bacterium]
MTTELTSPHQLGGHAPSPHLWPDVAHVPTVPVKARVAKSIVAQAVRRLPVRLAFPDGIHLGRR